MKDVNSAKFVSRAGEKLQFALNHFKINVTGKVCADLGCSTGGFTDCLLQNGAIKVYAVDTAYGELDWNLRNNPKVVVMERQNALHLELPEKVDFISVDVGWTKQKLIIPHALKLLKAGGEIISLVKLHYEAKQEWLKRGKLVEEHINDTLSLVDEGFCELNVDVVGKVKSPIVGKRGGNVEYLYWIKLER